MDNFFQKLRDVQNKERNTGTLSEIDDTFYDDASNYLQGLLEVVDKNPLSLEAYQLRNAQRITIEICEQREVKIISTAISNVQKSHDIFKGHSKDSQLFEEIPYNVTPEEEKLYKNIINTIIEHREDLMTEIVPNKNKDTKIGFKPTKPKTVETKEVTAAKPESTTAKKEQNPKHKSNQLTEQDIVAMYGEMPEDIVSMAQEESKHKTDITTPFTPPKVPEEDTVSLQNEEIQEKKAEKKTYNKPDKQADTQTIATNEDKTEDTTPIEDSPVSDIIYNEEELVVFKEEIATDILDENEKTYGPFKISDIVLLPKSIVEILYHRQAIDIIK